MALADEALKQAKLHAIQMRTQTGIAETSRNYLSLIESYMRPWQSWGNDGGGRLSKAGSVANHNTAMAGGGHASNTQAQTDAQVSQAIQHGLSNVQINATVIVGDKPIRDVVTQVNEATMRRTH